MDDKLLRVLSEIKNLLSKAEITEDGYAYEINTVFFDQAWGILNTIIILAGGKTDEYEDDSDEKHEEETEEETEEESKEDESF